MYTGVFTNIMTEYYGTETDEEVLKRCKHLTISILEYNANRKDAVCLPCLESVLQKDWDALLDEYFPSKIDARVVIKIMNDPSPNVVSVGLKTHNHDGSESNKYTVIFDGF